MDYKISNINLNDTSLKSICIICCCITLSCFSNIDSSQDENTNRPTVSIGPILTPGTGFTGPTAEPPRIGSGPGSDATVIAKYNVVPHQDFDALFNVGVPAFHINGVDRVEFAVEGGAWISVREMTRNPLTDTYEYWAQLRANDFSQAGPIEVRAIAYPKSAGQPRYVGHLFLNVFPQGIPAPEQRFVSPTGNDGNDGLTAATPKATIGRALRSIHDAQGGNADGGEILLMAGDHRFGPHRLGAITAHRFVTIQPAPGVTKDQARIVTSDSDGITTQLIHIHNVTIRCALQGHDTLDEIVWLDNSALIGNGAETRIGDQGPFDVTDTGIGEFWNDLDFYATNSTISDNFSAAQNAKLLRNVHAQNIGSEGFSESFVVNSSIDTIFRGSHTAWHPDLYDISVRDSVDNLIVYGLRAINIDAQGIFMKDVPNGVRNVAIINLLYEGTGGAMSHIHGVPVVNHFIMHHVTHLNRPFSFRTINGNSPSYTNISFKNSVFESVGGDALPADLSQFDNNHYIDDTSAEGTNVTLGDPRFQNVANDDFSPGANSPLCWPTTRQTLVSNPPQNLIPADFYGTERNSNLCIGAFQ